MRDEGAVFTEPFSQWIVEDRFAGPRPAWEEHGAQIVDDVAPYEAAKLRMLNGAHSLLAYAGLALGHSFVHEAIADPWLGPLVDRLMREEAAPTVQLWYATNDCPTTDDCTKIARFSLSVRSPTTYATSIVTPSSHPPLGRSRAERTPPDSDSEK